MEIKKVDKSNTLVIMDKEQYKEKLVSVQKRMKKQKMALIKCYLRI